MGIIKNKVEAHLKATKIQNDLQTGATSGVIVTENIHIIQCCIRKTYKMKNTVIQLINRLYQSL